MEYGLDIQIHCRVLIVDIIRHNKLDASYLLQSLTVMRFLSVSEALSCSRGYRLVGKKRLFGAVIKPGYGL